MIQQPLQQQEEHRQSPPKQQMQQVQQPLQQEEPRQSPLHKGNKSSKPLSKDEILTCVIWIEQDRPKYKPGAPMLSEANVKAAGPNCAKLMLMSWNMVRINLLVPGCSP
jgi:hypothetical protein